MPIVFAAGERALGRPWNNQSRVVYMDTYMVSPPFSSVSNIKLSAIRISSPTLLNRKGSSSGPPQTLVSVSPSSP